MASKTGRMLQDQNLNIRFNEASADWKTNVSKAPSKRGSTLAGRTPLGDVSNSLKPSMNRPTRKQSSTLFPPLIEKEAVTSCIALDATKKNTSKASFKQQPAGRKALSDISNSGKPQVNVASKRNYSTKLEVVQEVADEGFLHNHQECIKDQLGAMDMNQVLQIIGLDHTKQKSTLQTLSGSFRKEAVKHMKAEAMVDYLKEEVCWKYVPHDNSDSPPPCRTTPISAENSVSWSDHDCIDFKLTESP